MKVEKREGQIVLTPDDGMVLTNGNTFGKEVELPESADQNEWYEITEAEYIERTKAEEGDEV